MDEWLMMEDNVSVVLNLNKLQNFVAKIAQILLVVVFSQITSL